MEKMIIQVRLNESVKRQASPHIPYTPEEIADQAIACYRAGATMVHYHARDPETLATSSDPALYADILRRIRAECDIVTFPTGASIFESVEVRLQHIISSASDPATRPDLVPIDMALAEKAAALGIKDKTRELGVRPVTISWNQGGIRVIEAARNAGLYEDPTIVELPLFGDKMGAFGSPATGRGLYSLIEFMPRDPSWIWMADAIGVNAFPVNAATIELGGHAVTGVADYAYPELGYPTNAELVSRLVDMAKSMGREVATTAEARQMMGIS